MYFSNYYWKTWCLFTKSYSNRFSVTFNSINFLQLYGGSIKTSWPCCRNFSYVAIDVWPGVVLMVHVSCWPILFFSNLSLVSNGSVVDSSSFKVSIWLYGSNTKQMIPLQSHQIHSRVFLVVMMVFTQWDPFPILSHHLFRKCVDFIPLGQSFADGNWITQTASFWIQICANN